MFLIQKEHISKHFFLVLYPQLSNLELQINTGMDIVYNGYLHYKTTFDVASGELTGVES